MKIANFTNSTAIDPKPKFKGEHSKSANDYEFSLFRPYLIKGMLLNGQVGMLAGASNLGKSSILTSLACHLVKGKEIDGKRVRKTAVIYVAAEDAEGVLERSIPFKLGDPDEAHFEVFDMSLNFSDREEIEEFRDFVLEFIDHSGCDAPLIVIDTLNLCIGDADENSARDMGVVAANAQLLAKSTGAHVLFVHHVGTSDSGRPRGSSALTANIDTLLMLSPAKGADAEGIAVVISKKQRRIPKGEPFAFRLSSYEAGWDQDGDLITFPMALPLASRAEWEPANELVTSHTHAKQNARDRAEEVLRVMTDLGGADWSAWHSAKKIRDLVGGPFEANRKTSKEALRKAVQRTLDSLVDVELEADGKLGFRLKK